MKGSLDIAKHLLLDSSELKESQLEAIFTRVMAKHIDYADLYFQNTSFEHWALEDSVVKSASFNIDKGVGIRAVSGEKTGFAYSDDINYRALCQAAEAARSISHTPEVKLVTPIWTKNKTPSLYPALDPLNALDKQSKIALLEWVDKVARKQDSRVTQVSASLSGSYDVVLIINHEGQLVADVRPLVSLHVSVIVEENGKRECGRFGGGGRGDYQSFFSFDTASDYAKAAVREALINLGAVDAPAGTMPVVLGPGWPGVLLHEAVGHGLEGDFNRKGISAFSGKIGEKVAASGVTVIDDATIVKRRGSLAVDDEGTVGQKTVLIEDGILKGYMFDKLNARLMGCHSTGNCRRESYAHLPMPRMTNTYMQAGNHDPAEIIESIDKGLYAVNFGGGQVDITSGKFVFSASEAYLIEKGKITKAVKGATLIGNGPEVMKKISMIGTDLALDPGIGVCGKEGQSVPVGVGQPTLKIDALTVGGTK